MKRTTFAEKVCDIPFFPKGTKISKEIKRKYNLEEAYRMAFARGLGGSQKEATWSKKEHVHTCCGAKVPWRHKGACPNLGNRNDPDDLSDLKDI